MAKKSDDNGDDLMTLKEAAEYAHVTKQAVYVAMRKKAIPAVKVGRAWHVKRADLDAYRGNKYNRDERKDANGELIFDVDKGYFSVAHICKVFTVALKRQYSIQKLYYLLRTGQIRASKVGYAWVIAKQDAIDQLEKERAECPYQQRFA